MLPVIALSDQAVHTLVVAVDALRERIDPLLRFPGLGQRGAVLDGKVLFGYVLLDEVRAPAAVLRKVGDLGNRVPQVICSAGSLDVMVNGLIDRARRHIVAVPFENVPVT